MDTTDRTLNLEHLSNLEVRVIAFNLVEESLHVLLVPARLGADWEIPGAAVDLRQSLEEAATGQLLSLTGLHETYIEQLYTYGEPQRSPQGRLVSVAYFALVPAHGNLGSQTVPLQNVPLQNVSLHNKDVPQSKWFPVDGLPSLVCDHAEILAYALRRLRYKLEYTAVGFQLLPENFSLSELQRTYEMILGETLDKRNFRRRILDAGIIEPTSHMRGGEGRPARLYRYRPDAVSEVKTRRLFP
jgi:8-oxo-dGTP diphosphatase